MKQKELFANSSGAIFSDCRAYRYALWRVWDTSLPLIMFIGLNPSTANERKADPTIRRIIGFAKRWGYGGFYMMNLFPFVTPYPEALIDCELVQIQTNDLKIKEVSAKCKDIVFSWGNFKVAKERARVFIENFPNAKCLYKNKNGSPVHPLFVKGDTQLINF